MNPCSSRLRQRQGVNGRNGQEAEYQGWSAVPAGHWHYLITELSGKVIAFSYDDGCLEQIQTITADTVAARGSADIHLSPDGKYLYASNRLKEDGIAIFAVNPENGTLAKVPEKEQSCHSSL